MKTVASEVPFADLCTLCERIAKKKGKEKKNAVASFIQQWRNFHDKLHKDDPNTEDSFYPAMRLLLPHLERERLAYGIKEHTLAKLYIDILCLSKDSEDAQKLINYRTPKNAKADAGDFASIAYFILSSRCPEKGTLSVEDVNNCLDSIATNNAIKDKVEMKKSLLHLLRNTSAKEQKWLIRMIMKELKMGISENSVFSIYHPDAKDLFDVTSSLSKVCRQLRDPLVRLHEIDISLFSPFRPMLAEQASLEQIEKLMTNQPFFIETKYDGERVQLHIEKNRYMYFSRNYHDYTSSYGKSPQEGTITPYIAKCFRSDLKNCIIDGEMVGYNTELKCIGSKGENFDVKNLKSGDIYQPCIYVFDILLYNDKVLTNCTLTERFEYLKTLFTPIEGRIHLSEKKLVSTKQDVVNALNEAIDNHEEGVMIKNPSSVYCPNKRNGGWIKVKPEYVDNLIDELDLLIIGGYFGEGKRGGFVSHFLLGVSTSEVTDENSMFHSFAKVGSGYSFQELYDLLTMLTPYWKVYNKNNPPKNILLAQGHKEKPDVWIEPNKSMIVQVKAAEIIPSDRFKTGYTLRFPRVEKVRYDKIWNQCLTSIELDNIHKQAHGKLYSRHYTSTQDDEISPKKRRIAARPERPTVAPQFRPADVSKIEQKMKIFEEMEFCVMSGPPSHPKHVLEKMIAECGGTLVQNPGAITICILADKVTLRVKNAIVTKRYDVVKTDWLLRCIDQSAFLSWTPSDMWYTSAATSEKFIEDYDVYGDGFTEEATEQSLKNIFHNISQEEWSKYSPSAEEIAELEMKYFPNTSSLGLFRTCRIYIDDKKSIGNIDTKIPHHILQITELKLKLFGATIMSSITSNTSHIVTHSSDLSRVQHLQEMNKKRKKHYHLVTEKWVDNCIINKTLLNERQFHVAKVKYT